MFKKLKLLKILWGCLFLILVIGVGFADDDDDDEGERTFNNHEAPYTFLFGNHMDTHQEMKVKRNGKLAGFLYITFTGEYNENGVPIAKHCTHETSNDECVVGWLLKGKPMSATFVYHSHDHPIWLVDSRNDIPQPGSYSHFHWLGEPDHGHGLVANQEYDGYILQLRAIREFAFVHGGEQIHVKPGIDLATHLNIVASFPEVDGGGDGGDGGHDH